VRPKRRATDHSIKRCPEVLWKRSEKPPGRGWESLPPESFAPLAAALNELAVALIEAAPSLIVSPGSTRSIAFLQSTIQHSSTLRELPEKPAEVQKLQDTLAKTIPEFGSWQQKEVSLLVDGLASSLRSLVTTLGEAAETQGHAVESLATIQQNLEKARRCTDITEIKDALVAEIGSTKRLLDEQASLQKSMTSSYDASLHELEDRLEKAEEASQTDHLTMLANRAAFDYYGEAIAAKARHGDGRYALAMVDLDEFKAINDEHGHLIGDKVLNHFAGLLRHHLGQGTFIARFGGDEFTIVMAGASDLLARRLGMLLRVVCKKPAKLVHEGQNYQVKLGFSAGVTQVLPEDSTATALSRADANLYVSKRSGRGRVTQDDQRNAA
jgi:diguanylate cyclase